MPSNFVSRVQKFFLTAVAVTLAAQSLSATVLDKTKVVAGTAIHYKVVLPSGYDPAKAYPTVLAFPGGLQTMDTVEGTLERNWVLLAERLGYIVVIPAAPYGQLFFEGGDKIFPEFIVGILADFKVLNNKLHIAGVSNGGLSAFHIAALYPQYFISVTGLPGYLGDASPEHVRALAGMCINMYAGEMDTGWLNAEKQQAAQFRALGMSVQFSEEKGEGHVMRTLDGEGASRLFDQFAQARKGCGK
jgi:poly(3-hydroxybutyrate) depolymerase